MRWSDVRTAYSNQWLIIEALEAHSEGGRRLLDRIAVLETCSDGPASMQRYGDLHSAYPERELYFVHTSRETIEIRERRWLGIRSIYATLAAR